VPNLITKLYNNPVLEKLIPTQVYCLRNALADCKTVLDIGCGPSSPLQACGPFERAVGVEAYTPYIEQSRAKGIHHEYVNKLIEELDFPPKSFDAVIMIEVIEHMPEELGMKILKKAEVWAKKKVIVTSPNGFVPQKSLDGNPLQVHLSGWSLRAMTNLGFDCRGLAGLKVLRQEVDSETMGHDITSSMKFRPRFFWFAVSALSQILTYRLPGLAFEIFSVKRVRS